MGGFEDSLACLRFLGRRSEEYLKSGSGTRKSKARIEIREVKCDLDGDINSPPTSESRW